MDNTATKHDDQGERKGQEVFAVQNATPYLDFSKRHNAPVCDASVLSEWMYILTSTGELTIQNDFRLSQNISRPARSNAACATSCIAICPSDASRALVSLCYAPDPEAQASHGWAFMRSAISPRRTSDVPTGDLIATCCDGVSIRVRAVSEAAQEPITSIAWTSATSVLLGTATGTIYHLSNFTMDHTGKFETVLQLGSYTAPVTGITVIGPESYDEHMLTAPSPRSPEHPVIRALHLTQKAVPWGHRDVPPQPSQTLSGFDLESMVMDDRWRCVLVSAGSRLLRFIGRGSVATIIRNYADNNDLKRAVALHEPTDEPGVVFKLVSAPLPVSASTNPALWLGCTSLHLLDVPLDPISGDPVPSAPPSDDGVSVAACRPLAATSIPLSDLQIAMESVVTVATLRWHALVLTRAESNASRDSVLHSTLIDGVARERGDRHVTSESDAHSDTVSYRSGGSGALGTPLSHGNPTSSLASVAERRRVTFELHVISRITKKRVSKVHVPHSLGSVVALAHDPVTSLTRATSGWETLEPDAAASVTLFGTAGHADVSLARASLDVWRDFLAIDDYNGALAYLAETEQLLHLSGTTAPAAQQQLVEARARVLYARAQAEQAAGDWVAAAVTLGGISSAAREVAQIPRLRELTLWFCRAPGDDASEVEEKAKALVLFVAHLLSDYRHSPADATATSLAIWLLDLLLAQSAASSSSDAPGTPALSSPRSVPKGRMSHEQAVALTEAILGVPLTVHGLLEGYKAHLPYHVVQQLLSNACASMDDLLFVATLYEDWASVFHQCLPGDVAAALQHLPKLQATAQPSAIAELMRVNAKATCAALSVQPALAAVPNSSVLDAIGEHTQPSTPVLVRSACMSYLEELIFHRQCEESEVHELYIQLLALHEEEAAFERYLASPESKRHREHAAAPSVRQLPYLFDARRAARLAARFGKAAVARQLLIELGRYKDAFALAATYEDRLAVIDQVTDNDQRKHLWLLLAQVEVDLAGGAADAESVGRWLAAAARRGQQASHFTHSEPLATSDGELHVDDVLALLPEQATMKHCKEVLIKHMEASSRCEESMLQSTTRAVRMNTALVDSLRREQDMSAAFSLTDRCCSCRRMLKESPKCPMPSGGSIPPYQVYPTGSRFHTSCAVYRLCASSSDEAYKNELKGLLKKLTARSGHIHRSTNMGSTALDRRDPQTDISTWQHDLAKRLRKAGDPSNSSAVIDLLEMTYGASSKEAAAWNIGMLSV